MALSLEPIVILITLFLWLNSVYKYILKKVIKGLLKSWSMCRALAWDNISSCITLTTILFVEFRSDLNNINQTSSTPLSLIWSRRPKSLHTGWSTGSKNHLELNLLKNVTLRSIAFPHFQSCLCYVCLLKRNYCFTHQKFCINSTKCKSLF